MKNQKLGFWMATSLVMGNMIGSGIFFLPAALGKFGSISLFGWLVSSAGALALAFVFIRLARTFPGITGGPYIYSRRSFGDVTGYLVGWSYLVSVWLSMASIASAFVGYLAVFLPALQGNFMLSLVTGVAVTVLLTAVNMRGLRAGGAMQLVTTVLKISPLLIIMAGGLLYLEPGNFRPFNSSGDSVLSIVAATGLLTFFSFLGFDCAVIPAADVEDPERTIPLATLVGTLATTVIYILATVALIGMLSVEDLGQSAAPFADAASRLWGDDAAYLVSAGIVVSTFGALNGWILVSGQIMMAIARDGFFPPVLGKLNTRAAPGNSLLLACVVTILLMAASFSEGMARAFEFLVTISVATALFAYAVSGAAAVRSVRRDRELSGVRGFLALLPALLGIGFCGWALTSLTAHELLWALGLLAAGLPVYAYTRRSHA